MLFVVQAYLSF